MRTGPKPKVAVLTLLALLAFAGNSILCRIALKHTGIDAASFTSIRLLAGALVLWAIAATLRRDRAGGGNWLSALALFAYAAGFSFAYLSLTAAKRASDLQTQNSATAREALRLAEERYRVGANTFVDVQQARADYERAETDRINAVFEYHRAYATLEAAVGRPLR